MKKLLSILAAVGLTTTAATSVVACGSSSTASKPTKPDKGNGNNDGNGGKTPEPPKDENGIKSVSFGDKYGEYEFKFKYKFEKDFELIIAKPISGEGDIIHGSTDDSIAAKDSIKVNFGEWVPTDYKIYFYVSAKSAITLDAPEIPHDTTNEYNEITSVSAVINSDDLLDKIRVNFKYNLGKEVNVNDVNASLRNLSQDGSSIMTVNLANFHIVNGENYINLVFDTKPSIDWSNLGFKSGHNAWLTVSVIGKSGIGADMPHNSGGVSISESKSNKHVSVSNIKFASNGLDVSLSSPLMSPIDPDDISIKYLGNYDGSAFGIDQKGKWTVDSIERNVAGSKEIFLKIHGGFNKQDYSFVDIENNKQNDPSNLIRVDIKGIKQSKSNDATNTVLYNNAQAFLPTVTSVKSVNFSYISEGKENMHLVFEAERNGFLGTGDIKFAFSKADDDFLGIRIYRGDKGSGSSESATDINKVYCDANAGTVTVDVSLEGAAAITQQDHFLLLMNPYVENLDGFDNPYYGGGKGNGINKEGYTISAGFGRGVVDGIYAQINSSSPSDDCFAKNPEGIKMTSAEMTDDPRAASSSAFKNVYHLYISVNELLQRKIDYQRAHFIAVLNTGEKKTVDFNVILQSIEVTSYGLGHKQISIMLSKVDWKYWFSVDSPKDLESLQVSLATKDIANDENEGFKDEPINVNFNWLNK